MKCLGPYRNFFGVIDFDDEDKVYVVRVMVSFTGDTIATHADNLEDLEIRFREIIDLYLEVCDGP